MCSFLWQCCGVVRHMEQMLQLRSLQLAEVDERVFEKISLKDLVHPAYLYKISFQPSCCCVLLLPSSSQRQSNNLFHVGYDCCVRTGKKLCTWQTVLRLGWCSAKTQVLATCLLFINMHFLGFLNVQECPGYVPLECDLSICSKNLNSSLTHHQLWPCSSVL